MAMFDSWKRQEIFLQGAKWLRSEAYHSLHIKLRPRVVDLSLVLMARDLIK
jgi:hypothetical protein